MPTLTGINRGQIVFSNLECKIAQDNEIRFINAFVEKLNLKQLGINSLVQSTNNNPEYFVCGKLCEGFSLHVYSSSTFFFFGLPSLLSKIIFRNEGACKK